MNSGLPSVSYCLVQLGEGSCVSATCTALYWLRKGHKEFVSELQSTKGMNNMSGVAKQMAKFRQDVVSVNSGFPGFMDVPVILLTEFFRCGRLWKIILKIISNIVENYLLHFPV